MPAKPNVLLLLCDQMQHQRMGFLDPVAHTPFLDDLAAEGIHFRNAYTCHGQCVPARAALQTGLFPHECGVMVIQGFHEHQARLTRKYTTIGHCFKEAGYDTAYFGKTHFGVSLAELGYDTDGDHHPVSDAEAAQLGIGYVPKPLRPDYRSCDEAVSFLEQYTPGDERPLFMTFSTNLPHPPFFSEPRWAERFPAEHLDLAHSYYAETFADKPPFQKEHALDGNHGAHDELAQRQELAQYYTMIAEMDSHFARIKREYERLGLWENTVVLYLADHGDMMGAHKMRLKGTLPYEELYRIPCLMKLPADIDPPRRIVDDLISSVQAPATLMQAAGIDIPAQFHNGFYDAPFRATAPADEHIFFEHYAAYWGIHPFYAVRTKQYKYARYYGDDACEEMYDLKADPHELQNIAADPGWAAPRAELAQLADRWWQETGGRDLAYYESDSFKANEHNLLS